MDSLTLHSQHACFGGTVGFYSHASEQCRCDMRFSVYIPPHAKLAPVPVLYFLSGLTCTEENFMVKAGAQQYAAEAGLMLVVPDTSPRGDHVPDEEESWDFGQGAGFYVDATESPWNANYRMYSYVTEELPQLIEANFSVRGDRAGIFGHSMGGHGALVCGLRNPDRYRSISAFAPISAPSQCPWGQKALSRYLGENHDAWKLYDATELVKSYANGDRPILVDQGSTDPFLGQNQLLPEVLAAACKQAGQPLQLRMQEGYDHGYYFISTFMADHIRHHASALLA
ncbi:MULTISPECIES: S-formylglutathione hydrolase [unclassified Leptolyngbya]|uniref:S-formylglutathione hydrolase n=1 Tax=unclassified Leptolyngbya TaxID=2650499 RepID=UPI00168309B9|nr:MULTISPECIES: S-formylglutathione hydrolase [unclassified Leptolyngbya]MBD1913393.1 S-formylglutathione hydrolase [Leptolyngbya sp. FACHB-8]MBD2158676.1 S-formylglutathione hydrolase [Leptolyngbya sp. FACHB-16]